MDKGSDEKTPLLAGPQFFISSHKSGSGEYGTRVSHAGVKEAEVKLRRTLKLYHAVGIIVGSVIGSGIFISSRGVTSNAESVGASLVVWGATGVYTLLQALCYAELGCLLPVSGGDYSYIYCVFGPLPAFMVMWMHVIIIAPASAGAISQTAGLYISTSLGLGCVQGLTVAMGILIALTFAAINTYSVRWGARVQIIFFVAKVTALGVIIITGIVQLAKGSTANFQNPFEGTNTDVGLFALAILDGYYAYKGWECVNTLPEEMVNPKRDLPLAVWISILLITGIYTLTNVAYFSVLSPAEIIESDAVALSFADRTLGKAAFLVPVAVALSCMGAVNGAYITDTRYTFAAGRYRHLPAFYSMISYKYFTPIPSIISLCILVMVYVCIPTLDQLLEFASLGVQIKVSFSLVALLYLKWKRPHVNRPVSIHWSVVSLVLLLLVALVGLSVWRNPLTTGLGIGIFLLSIPVYFLITAFKNAAAPNTVIVALSDIIQKLCLVVPETNTDNIPLPANLDIIDKYQPDSQQQNSKDKTR